MGAKVLEKLIRDYMQLGFSVSSFAWQGGEPTLIGWDFFAKAVELQKQHGREGQVVSNVLQTNAVLLDNHWCTFLRRYNFLVGISLDGPQAIHDHYRRDHAGGGSYDKVIVAIEKCRAYKVDFNILVLLNDVNVLQPEELFDFFVGKRIKFLQFIPCVEKDLQTGKIADFSITAAQYGDFLCRIFDRWLAHGPDKISVRLFDSIVAYYVHGRHSNCTFAPRCNGYVVVEHNGDVFCCDFFVTEQWKLGNILERPLGEIFQNERKKAFAQHKRTVANKCFLCRYYSVCHGGCLKDRIVRNGDYQGVSYFCAGYQQFFDHALEKLREIAARTVSGATGQYQPTSP